MNDHIQSAKTYTITYKKELAIGAAVILGVIAIIIGIALFVYANTPKIVYQPTSACDLFTLSEAKELLGEKAFNSGAKEIKMSGNTATSQCGYADGTPDKDNMIIAALSVRSGINDSGVEQNKTEFANGKPRSGVETVKDLGDSAYFNQDLGQLNVLHGRSWIVLSYGVGSAPETNTVDKAIELAHKVIK